MTSIVVMAGEPEYESAQTMRPIADLLATELGASIHYRVPDVLDDTPEFPVSSFGDLAPLADADLLVLYTRFRNLPDEEVAAIAEFVARGGSLLALRTSTHAFHLAVGSPWFEWSEAFGKDIVGSPWISHHGHSSSTDVAIEPRAPQEFVAGLPATFHVRSWLYETQLAPWARPVLGGLPVDPETEPRSGPVAWYGEPRGRRTFYTSLGHPDDLVQAPVRTLLLNAARWAVAG